MSLAVSPLLPVRPSSLDQLPKHDRPRERLLSQGSQALSVVELVAVLLGKGTTGQPVMQMAQNLVARMGTLEGLAGASSQQLQQIKGIGAAKACQLLAALELARRVERERQEGIKRRPIANHPARIATLLQQQLDLPGQEHYWVISLSTRNHVLAIDRISSGTLDAALVHPRETFATAIRRRAAKIIVGHNHPSGDVQPSEDDLLVTRRLVTAGKVLGIEVVDHIILSVDEYYSLERNGQLGGR